MYILYIVKNKKDFHVGTFKTKELDRETKRTEQIELKKLLDTRNYKGIEDETEDLLVSEWIIKDDDVVRKEYSIKDLENPITVYKKMKLDKLYTLKDKSFEDDEEAED